MPEDVCVIAGEQVSVCPWQPFDNRVIEFLNSVAEKLLADKRSAEYPDIYAFAFWCRKKKMRTCAEKYREDIGTIYRIGRGFIFHIAPSNVPTLFGYSLAIGLLAGCTNIVRISEHKFLQTEILINAFNQVLGETSYVELRDRMAVITYDHNQEITRELSKYAAVRIIWGGDRTVASIRSVPTHPRCLDICFANRISLAILDCRYVLNLQEQELSLLARRFYQDTYMMDQNACSSPLFVFWKSTTRQRFEQASERFWKNVEKYAAVYEMDEKKAYDKFEFFCESAIMQSGNLTLKSTGNRLYRGVFQDVPDSVDGIQGKFGLFYEGYISDLHMLSPLISEKIQTVAAAGIERTVLADWLIQDNLTGIDRIVAFGEAMEMDFTWDGIDLISHLSRIIAV